MDNFVDPVDSMTIERHVRYRTTFDATNILRRFPGEWKKYKGQVIGIEDVEGDADIYEDDVADFLRRLGEDYGWETIFGNEWHEDDTEVEIYG